ncbi:phosphoribosyl transferase [Mycobacterium phage Kimona]|uniref:Phosphoribosyl transferase n=1 Tax=Mycobacterium phage Kimona TaxID=2024295 RepID=A0A249XU86_9CAUD|nr:phosphoribosyl transferase [Mycobacterium phage Kimona]ASZ75497.1 phosphoribosyl transferase [Mycobacterium phage Kimona]
MTETLQDKLIAAMEKSQREIVNTMQRNAIAQMLPTRPEDRFSFSVPQYTYVAPQGLYEDVPQRVLQGQPAAPKPEEKTVLDLTDETYLRVVHQPDRLKELADQYLAGVEYDTLVGTGLSGTIAVTTLARLLDKNYLVVRKPNDGTHSSQKVEGKLGKKWVFVDDLIATGTTFARVWDAMHLVSEKWNFTSQYVGAFLYSDGGWYDPNFIPFKDERTDMWLRKSEYYNAEQYPGVSW